MALKRTCFQLGVLAHTCDPRTWEAEARGSPRSQPELHRETLSLTHTGFLLLGECSADVSGSGCCSRRQHSGLAGPYGVFLTVCSERVALIPPLVRLVCFLPFHQRFFTVLRLCPGWVRVLYAVLHQLPRTLLAGCIVLPSQ